MPKRSFRPRPAPSPAYPDLDRFEERRGFLRRLGALVLGSALLVPLGVDAGEAPAKKKDKKKKKKDDGEDKPRPPIPGGKAPPPSRQDKLEEDAWAETAGHPSKDEKRDKKKEPKKKDKDKRPPPPPTAGEPMHPHARIDGDEE